MTSLKDSQLDDLIQAVFSVRTSHVGQFAFKPWTLGGEFDQHNIDQLHKMNRFSLGDQFVTTFVATQADEITDQILSASSRHFHQFQGEIFNAE